jgi:3-oxoacyl-[acyl-carrier protein] reductase
MKLRNKIAVITGAGSGIGRESALLLADEGARVVVVDLDPGSAQQTSQEIRNEGGETLAIEADVSTWSGCKSLVDQTTEFFGGVDILFNNAGIPMPKSLELLSEEDWDRTMAVNLKSVFLCTKLIVPKMIDRGGGAIVSTASVAGQVGSRGQVAYSVSKAGIISFTQCMAIELAPFHIRINCICPGFTDTPMLRSFLSKWYPDNVERERMVRETQSKAALNRYGNPKEIALAALFLVSDDASFITGQALAVDGGTTINVL